MATQVQLRRGTSTENDSFTGAQGELTYDTTNKRVRIHDGGTAGGFEIKTEDGSGNTIFADNEKAIFGAGSDLQIYHDGSNSYISDQGDGNLLIQAATNTQIKSADGTLLSAKFRPDLAADLYYNNQLKFSTTSTGIDVTGTATMDGLTVDKTDTATYSSTAVDDTLVITRKNSSGTNNQVVGIKLDVTQASGVTTGVAGISAVQPTSANSADLVFQTRNSGTFGERMRIDSGGDISFYEDTGTTPKLFWDASEERLGIGTSTMFESLRVVGTRQNTSVGYDTVVSFYSDDAFSSNAGAGLSFGGKYNTAGSSTGFAEIAGVKENSTDGNYAGALVLKTRTNGTSNIAERMRIDSSGNLLVGKSSADSNTEGVFISTAGGGSNFVRAGTSTQPNVIFNKKTNDGSIVEFRKDNSAVGSIGGFSNHLFIGNDDVGIRFINSLNAICPVDVGAVATSNDVIDLGRDIERFKDLYLSGGVYLGGTASANLLDSYEEGTWIPSLAGSSTAGSYTYSDQSGYYIKVGNKVTLTFNVELSAVNSAGSGFLRIKGSPFSTSGGVAAQFALGSIILNLVSFNGAANTLVVRPRSSSSTEFVIDEVFDGSGTTEVSATDLGNSSEVNGQITLLLTS